MDIISDFCKRFSFGKLYGGVGLLANTIKIGL